MHYDMEYIPSLISTIVQYKWCPKSASQWPWLWCGYSTAGHPLLNSNMQPILLISYQFGFLLTNLSAIMTCPKPQISEATLSNDEKLLAAMDCYRINTKVSIRALAKHFGVLNLYAIYAHNGTINILLPFMDLLCNARAYVMCPASFSSHLLLRSWDVSSAFISFIN